MNSIPVIKHRFFWILCGIACLFIGLTAANGAEFNNLKLMPLAGLEKGRAYQVRVQAVCQDKNAHFFNPPGGFKTDWHTVDFTF